MTDPTPADVRASDAERDRAAEILRDAATDGRLEVDELEERLQEAYATRTRRELELLVADVNVEQSVGGRQVAPARAGGGIAVREGPGGARWTVSIMGGNDRRGHWRIAPRSTVLNIMGGSDIDMNDVELSDPVTQLNVYSVMGGGDVRVPHGVHVEVSKFAFMGGNDVRLGDEVPPPGAPMIRIRLISVMGGSNVRRGRRRSRAARRRERELRASEQPGELDA